MILCPPPKKYLKPISLYDSSKTSIIMFLFPFFMQYLLSYAGGWWLKSWCLRVELDSLESQVQILSGLTQFCLLSRKRNWIVCRSLWESVSGKDKREKLISNLLSGNVELAIRRKFTPASFTSISSSFTWVLHLHQCYSYHSQTQPRVL